MDDKKLPTLDTPPDVPPVGDTSVPPVPPMPEDGPPLPPLSPEKVKTPTLPIPKDEEKVVPTDDPSSKPDVVTPPIIKKGSDTILPKESAAIPQPNTDEVTPVLQPDTSVKPKNEKSIAPPEKEEMPVEAEFPGQPLPVEAQQSLEDKAKEMIDKDGGVKNRKVEVVGKPKGNVKKTLVGMLLFVLVGGGAFAGMKLMGNTTENRSQAGGFAEGCSTACINELNTTCDDHEKPGERIECSSDSTCWKICPSKWEADYCTPGDIKEGAAKSCNCCDGSWQAGNEDLKCNSVGEAYYSISNTCSSVCSSNGGYGSCDGPVTLCTCESWASQYACGLNCTFPTGVGYEGQRKADSECKQVIAMCNVGTGEVSYEVFTSNHECRGHVDECNNPVYEPRCDGPKACNEGCVEGECGDNLACDTTTNTCRDPLCSEESDCECPGGDVICNDLTCDQSGLELGKSYSFTCSASVTGNKMIETYDFRYKRNNQDWANLPLASVDSNVSSELSIEDPGNYVIECRACEDRTNEEKCTPYQIPDSH